MAVDVVNSTSGTSSTGTSSAAASGKNAGSMSPEDFYKILIAELQYQDPSQPMDNAQMVQQVANIQSIQSSTAMTSALQSVTRQQNYGTASALIGKQITATVADAAGQSQTVTGVVQSVQFTSDGKATLELDDKNKTKVPLESVTTVQSAVQSSSAGGNSNSGNGNSQVQPKAG